MTTPFSDLISLTARPEKRLLRPGGSQRHVLFTVKVGPAPARAAARLPLSLGIVLDRSGSMHGEKLETAKRAALTVLERLDECDEVSVTVFDHQVDVLQERAPVTRVTRERLRRALSQLESRGNTALHEGWLVGCRTLASERAPQPGGALARCFLLTDGLANVGITDPEQIATEAAEVREHAGIATSTFGIGNDYDESLLGPMAVAGGGRFSHLRSTHEIVSTFAGELGELLSVAAPRVRLQIEFGAARSGVTAESISAYWGRTEAQSGRSEDSDRAIGQEEPAPYGHDRRLSERQRLTIDLGDLMHGEERPVVVRFSFPPAVLAADASAEQLVRARVLWEQEGRERATEFREIGFRYASEAQVEAELRDAEAMHWVGLQHADRARRVATEQSKRGDLAGAKVTLQRVRQRITSYAGADSALAGAVDELREVEQVVTAAPAAPAVAKEITAEAYRRSRGQRDIR